MKHRVLRQLTGVATVLLLLSSCAGITGKGVNETLYPLPGVKSYTNTIGMSFNLIRAGTFVMGSLDTDPGLHHGETQHQVNLTKSFYMQTTEVTQKQWQELITKNPAQSNQGDDYPMETVNWFEAAYFANALSQAEGRNQCYTLTGCSSLPGKNMRCSGVRINVNCASYRLPTEAEWEYAARATTTTAWSYFNNYDTSVIGEEIGEGFNSNLHAMGWYAYNNEMENSNAITAYPSGTKPVAKKQPNKWGLLDMHGNVSEWCQDWYGAYPANHVTDPIGPEVGSGRVYRGGSWYCDAACARSARRGENFPSRSGSYLGFRLVLSQN